MYIKIRKEEPEDYKNITEINNEAFGQNNEGWLVESLRTNPKFISELSLVAEVNKKIVGHILFFPVHVIYGNIIYETLSLAPMSVLTEYQLKGVGHELINTGLEIAQNLGFKSVIVLGHKNYYSKFGFEPASKWGIQCPYDVPDGVFMAKEIVSGGLNNIRGLVEYPVEFDEMG